nr:A/G-specific adenine glycosylase [Granulibacter bethesdensis]
MERLPIPPASALLEWYARHRRSLPWRALPGEIPDPYRVWLSEVMLQQTTVTAVIPYFERFITRFPTVQALAAAQDEAVMAAWAGLGYYARARNLLACARRVAGMGAFPKDIEALRSLPGIGVYTSAAVAAIAFGIPAVPVDGNVERVTSRLFAIEAPLPQSRPLIAAQAAQLGTDPVAMEQPSDFAQALFDLGATICTPLDPACALCPWMRYCEGRKQGIAASLPRKSPKKLRPQRYGVHFWLTDEQGNVLLRRRAERGLLGGMMELPGTPWQDTVWQEEDALYHAPKAETGWRKLGVATHVFTHFALHLTVYAAQVGHLWADPARQEKSASVALLDEEALPSVMMKCVALGRGGQMPGAADPVSAAMVPSSNTPKRRGRPRRTDRQTG